MYALIEIRTEHMELISILIVRAQAFQALQTAYIRLLRNPFYVPDDHDPKIGQTRGSVEITSPRFIKAVQHIGNVWYPGITSI